MLPIIHQIATEYKKALQELYGDDLTELVLFGSYARGNQHSESDMDFAVVLRNNCVPSFNEIKRNAVLDSRLSLKYGLMLSSLVTSSHKKNTSMQGIYQEIRKEGINI